MLMVIFGAGASYDSCSSFRPVQNQGLLNYRLPLARDLFANLREFRDISRIYPRVQRILPFLENVDNVEDKLEAYRTEGEGHIERRRQLTAVKYYLRDVIELCQKNWSHHTSGLSNYQAFLDQVSVGSDHRICFVTFNYDTLLEQALREIDVPVGGMGDYISHVKYGLIKLHGSTDWVHWVPRGAMNTQNAALGGLNHGSHSKALANGLIRAAPNTDVDCVVDHSASVGRQERWRVAWPLPALAIPTVSKHTFVCPPEHLDHLKALIPQVAEIIIVGWRGGESHFLKLVKEGLTRPVRILAACGSAGDSKEPYTRMTAAGVPLDAGNSQLLPIGFSDLVVSGAIKGFL